MSSIAPPNHTRNDQTTDDWITPQWLVERIGPFDLDPCACDPQPWPCAERQYTREQDGLLMPWAGFVYCNPPYGRSTGIWLNRMAQHGSGIALVFARTETEMFFDAVWRHCDAALFLKGRLHFHFPDGTRAPHNSGGPSVLIGYGHKAAWKLNSVRDIGQFVVVDRNDCEELTCK